MAKDKDKKPKAPKKGKGEPKSQWPEISVAAHPRASASIRLTKAWAALLGFTLVLVLSLRAGIEPFEAGVRALATGVALYVVVWMAGVALWRGLVTEEARQEGERRRAEIEAQLRAAREAADGGPGAGGGEAAA